MPKIDRDGVKIYYESHGRGPAVLLSHGFSATCEMWAGQVQALAPRFQVLVWDMRGHGQSDYPAEPQAYSEALTVGDMAAVLDACGVQRAVIGGLSLGGYMSLAFHAALPRRVQALMLFDTGPGYRSDTAREEWNARARERAAQYEARGLAVDADRDEMKICHHRSAAGLAGAARGMLAQRNGNVIESLPGIAVPTLVLAGADDTPFLGATDYMAKKIPGAHKVLIPQAGHVANVHQPAAFNKAVLDFLAGLPAD